MNTVDVLEGDLVTYPLHMGYIPSEFAEKLRNELNETPEEERQKIQQLRDLLRSNWNPSEISYEDVMRYGMQTMCSVIGDPMTQVNGMIVIFDFENTISLKYARFISPYYVHLYYTLCQECMPVRMKTVHGLHFNIFTKLAASVILSLVPEKLKKRIFVHRHPKDVLNCIQGNVIPVEYGGRLHPNQMKNNWAKTISMPDYVKNILRSTEP